MCHCMTPSVGSPLQHTHWNTSMSEFRNTQIYVFTWLTGEFYLRVEKNCYYKERITHNSVLLFLHFVLIKSCSLIDD